MFRSALDALDMLEQFKARGIGLHMIDLGGDVTGNGISKLVFAILSAVAEAERDRIRERIAAVKADQRIRRQWATIWAARCHSAGGFRARARQRDWSRCRRNRPLLPRSRPNVRLARPSAAFKPGWRGRALSYREVRCTGLQPKCSRPRCGVAQSLPIPRRHAPSVAAFFALQWPRTAAETHAKAS
jgi:hypothetical protein